MNDALLVRPASPYDEQGRTYHERVCPGCGRTMWTLTARRKWCTRKCQMREWRAASMLAGTHDWRKRGTGQHDWSLQRVSEPRAPKDPRQAIWDSIKEKRWREQVVTWATRADWLVYFTWRSTHSPAGFPDLVLVRDGRLVVAELKTEHAPEPKGLQAAWLAALRECGIEVFVWRPHHEAQVRRVLLEGATG